MPSDSFCFLEQTDFSVRFARCANPARPLRIEELTEVTLAELPALLGKVDPAANVVCALRPKPSHLRLATADEARKFTGVAGVHAYASQPAMTAESPAWFASVQAADGGAPGSAPWLLSTASTEAFAVSDNAFASLKASSRRNVSATLATIGALVPTAAKPILVLEIGELLSHALLVAREGVIGVQPISLNLDQIAAAVQAELGLKFRGSAAKLFFNADYDFTDTAPKIVGQLAATLKSDIAPLFKGRTPSAFFCAGLPAAQTWFAPQLAAVLNLPLHPLDIKAWSETARVTFATPELSTILSPAWLGLLQLTTSSVPAPATPAPWQATWVELKSVPATAAAVAQPASAPATVAPQPAAAQPAAVQPSPQKPAAAPAAAATVATAPKPTAPVPAVKPVPAPAAAPAIAAKPAVAPVATAAAVATPATAKAATPAPATKAVQPATTTPSKATPSAVNYSAKPASAEKSTQKSDSKKNPESAAAKPAPATPSVAIGGAKSPAVPAALPARKNNVPLFVGAAIVLVVLLLGGFYLYSQKQEAARLLAEKQKTEERLRAEEEKARIAQEKAQQEAESRKQLELTAAQKLAQAETARAQAEQEARAQVAARLANARGTLVVTTVPAGASVKVGDLPPRSSPATFSDIKIGKYPATISLARYDSANLELEVRENTTTDSGVITLERVFGTLELTTTPDGTDFELHPANALMVAPDARRTGRTPATISDLSPDDYAVTFTRDGWAPHTETVTVARGGTAHLNWSLPNGAVVINSTPEGASVTRAGVTLGKTPLALSDQHPGEETYEVTMEGFDPVTLHGKIIAGAKLELAANFPPADRFYTVNEVDQKPDASNTKQPELPYYLTLESGRVEIELIVNRDGSTRNAHVVQSSHPDFGKYCLAAIAKWKFKPGIKDGKPVNVRMSYPFVFTKGK